MTLQQTANGKKLSLILLSFPLILNQLIFAVCHNVILTVLSINCYSLACACNGNSS